MRSARTVYALARADFLERVRRYSFLLTVAGVAFCCYHVQSGNLGIQLDGRRGTMNSAWLGAVMTLMATIFLTLFGFYIVKNAIARDERTGVGQILAATPVSRVEYIFGKALSNFAVLAFILVLLGAAAPGLQLLAGEDTRLDFGALLLPIGLVAAPVMAVVAALAVLFESIPALRGGLGNLLYFFLFNGFFIATIQVPSFDLVGVHAFEKSIREAIRAAHLAPGQGFVFGAGPHRAVRAFDWKGFDWTAGLVAQRLAWLALAVALCLIAAALFDRFGRMRKPAVARRAQPAEDGAGTAALSPVRRVHELSPVRLRPALFHVWLAELRLMLRGRSWWWYAGAGGAVVAGLMVPPEHLHAVLIPALVWPILVWSPMGCREALHATGQYVFSAPHPVRRQLVALWLAGCAVCLAMAGGVAVRLMLRGDGAALGALAVGALLPPSLALCLGVWTGSSKFFEVAFGVIWYLGPVNRMKVLDFTFPQADPDLVLAYAAGVVALVALAGVRRSLR